jgi:tryptophan synthase alpha chain
LRRIEEAFAGARRDRRAAFIPYLTAGDPSAKLTLELVLALERAGADLVELGVPFSDPLADGAVNQRAAARALAGGTTLAGVLEIVRRVRDRSSIPLILFTYVNPLLRMGMERFARAAAGAGVDGVLATDLPVEESDDYRKFLLSCGIAPIFLVAPTTAPARLPAIAAACRGFVYYVARTGVTGERQGLPPELREGVARLRESTSLPIAVGFGVSTRSQVEEIAAFADGFVVGSALVKAVEDAGARSDLAEALRRRVREILPEGYGRSG